MKAKFKRFNYGFNWNGIYKDFQSPLNIYSMSIKADDLNKIFGTIQKM